MSQLEILATLGNPKALQIFEFITVNEFATTEQITKEFGYSAFLIKKLESKGLIYQVTDPLSSATIWKPTLRSKQILSAICSTMRDIEAVT